MKRIVLTFVIAAAAVMAVPATVLAANAVVTRDSDVYRSATSNRVVNEVEEDQLVTVTECTRNRCLVEIPGRDGWMPRRWVEPYEERSGRSGGSLTFNFGGVGVTIGEGGGGSVTIGGSSGPSSGPRACFYEHAGYAGASFCVGRGDSLVNLQLNGFNDRISSIRTYGGARVEACEHAGYAGSCETWRRDVRNLGGFNDVISSINVY